MVKPDIYSHQNNVHNVQDKQVSGVYIARPLDRLAAQVFDSFVILYPLISLISSGVIRFLDVSITFNDDVLFGDLANILFLISFITVIIYQTISLALYGTTLGKKVMGLRVIKIWNSQKPNFFESLLRSMIWGGQWILFGIPFLSVIANQKRRGLHDRISETVVVTDNESKASLGPTHIELSFVKGVNVAWISALSLYLLAVIVSSMVNIGKYDLNRIQLGDSSASKTCDAVSTKSKKWNSYKIDQPHRLIVAMTLFTAGEIDETCLDAEAEYALDLDENKSLAYLAKSFTTANKPELSNSYLDRVCTDFPESDDCLMSHVVNAWYQKDFEKVNKLFKTFNNDNKPDYLKVWGLYQFYKVEQYALALDLANGIKGQKALANVLLPIKVRTLWGLLKVDDARRMFNESVNFVEDTTQWDMASWMCFEESLRSCDFKNRNSCKFFKGNLGLGFSQDQEIANLTLISQALCQEEPIELFASSDPKVNDLYEIVIEKQFYKKKRELLEIIFNSEEDQEIRRTALRIYMHSSDSSEDFGKLISKWKAIEDTDKLRSRIGLHIYQGLYHKKQFKLAYSMKLPFFESDFADHELAKQVVVTAYRNDKVKEAISYLDNLKVNEVRTPASASEYEQVKRILIKEILK